MGEQPLHTDGAHLPIPPDVVVLSALTVSTTPTLLWTNLATCLRDARTRCALQDGVFLATNGRQTFLTTAVSATGLRYDPVCMAPRDARARSAAALLADTRMLAFPYDWDDPSKLLLIDNTATMHARSAVAEGDKGRVLQRIAFKEGQSRR
jgi:alpha-ketoglutarate-dependent taurine dioxygenase